MVLAVACFKPKHCRGPDGLISSPRLIHKYILVCCRLGESIDQWEGETTGDMLLVIQFRIFSCKVLAPFHSSCFINLSTYIFVALFLYDPLLISHIRLYLHESPDLLRMLRISCRWLSTLLMFSQFSAPIQPHIGSCIRQRSLTSPFPKILLILSLLNYSAT